MLSGILDRVLSIRLFYRISEQTPSTQFASVGNVSHSDECPLEIPPSLLKGRQGVTTVPCTFIATHDRHDWDYALCCVGV